MSPLWTLVAMVFVSVLEYRLLELNRFARHLEGPAIRKQLGSGPGSLPNAERRFAWYGVASVPSGPVHRGEGHPELLVIQAMGVGG